jgi:hypothetical protein
MPAGLLLTAPLVDCRRCTSTSVPKISSFRWKRSATVRALLTGLAGGHVPLSHDGLDAAGQSRQVSHLRSLLEHNGPLPQRDEPLARFQTWLGCKLDATREPAVRAPVEQFATWHHPGGLAAYSRRL